MITINMKVQLSDDGFQAVYQITRCRKTWTLSPNPLRAHNMDDALREAAQRVGDLQKRYARS